MPYAATPQAGYPQPSPQPHGHVPHAGGGYGASGGYSGVPEV